MPDNRFPSPGVDARFPSPGTDIRFPGGGVDIEHPSPGVDARFEGGSYGGVAPVVSGVSYDIPTEELSFTVTGSDPMTMRYVSTASITPPSAATIIATPDGTAVVVAGINYLDTLVVNTNPGTWYLHFLVSNAGGNSAINTITYTGAAFDPASLAGARIVLDPSDITTLWQNTDGTGQVTASGQSVGSVTNRGSLGGRFSNAGAGVRPLYTEASGRKKLDFDGTDDILTLDQGAGPDFDLEGGFSLFVVAFDDGTSNNLAKAIMCMTAVSTNSDNSNDGFEMLINNFSGGDDFAVSVEAGLNNANGITSGLKDTRTTTIPWSILEFECVPSAASPSAWFRIEQVGDGGVPVQIGTADPADYPNSSTATKRMIFGARVGGGSTPDRWAKCSIAGAVLISGTLTTTERNNIRAWCRTRAAF
jgi:hypothetical protein